MKKSASILLVIVLIFAMTTPAYTMLAPTNTISFEGGETLQRYVAINSISAGISMNGGTATCTGYLSHSGASARVQLVLQHSTNGGRTFSDLATLSNQTYTTRIISVQGTRSNLNTSSMHRTKVVATIFDASGKQIDSGTAFSPAR